MSAAPPRPGPDGSAESITIDPPITRGERWSYWTAQRPATMLTPVLIGAALAQFIVNRVGLGRDIPAAFGASAFTLLGILAIMVGVGAPAPQQWASDRVGLAEFVARRRETQAIADGRRPRLTPARHAELMAQVEHAQQRERRERPWRIAIIAAVGLGGVGYTALTLPAQFDSLHLITMSGVALWLQLGLMPMLQGPYRDNLARIRPRPAPDETGRPDVR